MEFQQICNTQPVLLFRCIDLEEFFWTLTLKNSEFYRQNRRNLSLSYLATTSVGGYFCYINLPVPSELKQGDSDDII